MGNPAFASPLRRAPNFIDPGKGGRPEFVDENQKASIPSNVFWTVPNDLWTEIVVAF